MDAIVSTMLPIPPPPIHIVVIKEVSRNLSVVTYYDDVTV